MNKEDYRQKIKELEKKLIKEITKKTS